MSRFFNLTGLCLLFALFLPAMAQMIVKNSVQTEVVRITEKGSMGVGTATPVAKLTIQSIDDIDPDKEGGVAVTALPTEAHVQFNDPTGYEAASLMAGKVSSSTGTESYGYLALSVKNPSNAWVESARLTSSGLGLGVTDPLTYRLYAAGSTRLDHLNINGRYSLPTVDGTSGYVLKTNGSGAVSWQPDATGSGSADLDWLPQGAANDAEIYHTGNVRVGHSSASTAKMDVTGSTASLAPLRLRIGTAPASPNSGDIWHSGGSTDSRLYFRAENGTLDITGDVRSVTAGTGLSGGGTTSDLTLNARTSEALWNANKLQGYAVATTAPAANQVLKWNATNSSWEPGADANTGYDNDWLPQGAANNALIYHMGVAGIGTATPQAALEIRTSGNKELPYYTGTYSQTGLFTYRGDITDADAGQYESLIGVTSSTRSTTLNTGHRLAIHGILLDKNITGAQKWIASGSIAQQNNYAPKLITALSGTIHNDNNDPSFPTGYTTFALRLANGRVGANDYLIYGFGGINGAAKSYLEGKLGIGTTAPQADLHVQDDDDFASILITGKYTDLDPVTAAIHAGNQNVRFNSTQNLIITSDTDNTNADNQGAITFACNSEVIGSPNWKLLFQVKEDKSLYVGSGATCTVGGVWTNASSRAYKENIDDISESEALQTVMNLNPVKYNYIVDPGDVNAGFIAEDVPELVASKDRKGLSPMDIVAVLTKVVQAQQKQIEKLNEMVQKQK